MRLILLAAVILLTACQSEGERADRKIESTYYEASLSGASPDELCATAFDVAVAYQNVGNSRQADQWDAKASAHCVVASLGPLRGKA